FPDPDLNPLSLEQAGIGVAEERRRLPELPEAKRLRFVSEYRIPEYDAGVLSGSRQLAAYYEELVSLGTDPKPSANWVMGSVLSDANEHESRFRVSPKRLSALIGSVEKGTVSLQAAKRIFGEIAERDADPAAVAEHLGLTQVGDADQLGTWVDAVLAANPDEV